VTDVPSTELLPGALAIPRPTVPTSRRAIADRFLAFFSLVLGGYALGSKGFAYLGVAPLYIGEISLVFGVFALFHTHTLRRLLHSPLIRVLVAFMAFGAIRTAPYLRQFGLDALRDGVLWGYGLFSLIVAGILISQPERIWSMMERFRRFVPIFLVGAPLVWLATVLLNSVAHWIGIQVPTWPGTDVPIIDAKAGDMLVHLGGVAAFMIVGLGGRTRKFHVALLALGVGLTALSRGGLLAFALAFLVAFVSRPRSRTAWSTAAFFASIVALLAVTSLHVRFPGNDRDVSFQQLLEHFKSTAGSDGDQDLENTKAWRLAWWATIVSYTIGGDYRWSGKGYGINLATDDGFQTSEDDSLRSPHNATMTVLARSGVIGLVLWLLLHGAWFTSLLRAMRHAARHKAREWYALFVFLLAYWLALLVNGSFDVYLEGPPGGIWLWSVIGFGIAAEMTYRRLQGDQMMPRPLHSTLN
jgi:O-antigen ligase/polysaccharide polymerase Wzy-like membrane protein